MFELKVMLFKVKNSNNNKLVLMLCVLFILNITILKLLSFLSKEFKKIGKINSKKFQ